MKRLTLKQTGVLLTIIGAIALTVSTGLMMSSFHTVQTEPSSATELAEGLSLSLIPSKIGMPLFLGGLVILFVSWLREPKRHGFVVNRRD